MSNQTSNQTSEKFCRFCKRTLPRSEFYRANRAKDGLKHRCKECDKAKAAEYYRENRDAIKSKVATYKAENPEVVRNWNRNRPSQSEEKRLNLYGVTAEEYQHMLDRCGGRCESCGRDPWEVSNRGPHIDHCHETGHVRGILCFRCNTGLGHFRDSIEDLERAIDYLRKFHGRLAVS